MLLLAIVVASTPLRTEDAIEDFKRLLQRQRTLSQDEDDFDEDNVMPGWLTRTLETEKRILPIVAMGKGS